MTFRRPLPLRDNGNLHASAYESLLDLFTVISFVLIFAAFAYVNQTAGRSENWSSVVAQMAQKGSGSPQALPNDTLLLVIYRSNSQDTISILDGRTGFERQQVVTVNDIEKALNEYVTLFEQAVKVDVAVYKDKEDVNPAIHLAVSRWLAQKKIKYSIYYT